VRERRAVEEHGHVHPVAGVVEQREVDTCVGERLRAGIVQELEPGDGDELVVVGQDGHPVGLSGDGDLQHVTDALDFETWVAAVAGHAAEAERVGDVPAAVAARD